MKTVRSFETSGLDYLVTPCHISEVRPETVGKTPKKSYNFRQTEGWIVRRVGLVDRRSIPSLAAALFCWGRVPSRRRAVAAEIGYRNRTNFLWRHQKFEVGGLHGVLSALGNRDGSVGVANRSRAGRPNVCGFIPLRGTQFFLSSKSSRPSVWPTHPPAHWVPLTLRG